MDTRTQESQTTEYVNRCGRCGKSSLDGVTLFSVYAAGQAFVCTECIEAEENKTGKVGMFSASGLKFMTPEQAEEANKAPQAATEAPETDEEKQTRELNELVAEALGKKRGVDFGDQGEHDWEWVDDHWLWGDFFCIKCGSHRDAAGISKDDLPASGCYIDAPKYSTDWKYAGEALEWLDKTVADPLRWVGACYEISGRTYPHAIALVVVEVAKTLQAKG